MSGILGLIAAILAFVGTGAVNWLVGGDRITLLTGLCIFILAQLITMQVKANKDK